jgi:two-component system, OmpR family, response regulator NblR
MPENSPILLVENDIALAEKMSLDLTKAGYHNAIASNAQVGFEQVKRLHPAMVVVDRALPGDSALELIERLRADGCVMPILLLMAHDTIADRIACLESGADDYFLKPDRGNNLLQIVGMYLRSGTVTGEQLRFADLVLDLSSRHALRGEYTIDLTMKEFELLKYLMSHPEEELTREQILENVWGYDFLGESNVIEVYIRYLRLKLNQAGGKPLIQTVRRVGYVLREG